MTRRKPPSVHSLTKLTRKGIAEFEPEPVFEACPIIEYVLGHMRCATARRALVLYRHGTAQGLPDEIALLVGVRTHVQQVLKESRIDTRRGSIRRYLCWRRPKGVRRLYTYRGRLTADMAKRVIDDRGALIGDIETETELLQIALPFLEELTTLQRRPATWDDIAEAAGF